MKLILVIAIISMLDPISLAGYIVVWLAVPRWWVGVPLAVGWRASIALMQGTFDAAPQTPAALLGAVIASALLYALRAVLKRALGRSKSGLGKVG
jgi:hypothetical protein